jgi:hypothetical protein
MFTNNVTGFFVVVVYVCFHPQKTGPCRGSFRKYFYNGATGQCEKFTYGGCKGNLNNFDTQAECG